MPRRASRSSTPATSSPLDRERRIIQDGSILDRGRPHQPRRQGGRAGRTRGPTASSTRATSWSPRASSTATCTSATPTPCAASSPTTWRARCSTSSTCRSAMTEDEEYHTTLLGIVELLKSGTVCFVDPGSTKFPDACLQAYEDAGIRVDLGRVRDRPEAPLPLPRYADRRGGRAHRRRSSRSGTGGSTGGSGRGRCRSRRRRAAPSCCSALKRVADEHRHGADAAPRERAQGARGRTRPGTAQPRPQYLESLGRARAERRCWRTCLGLDDAEIDVHGAHAAPRSAMCPVTAAKGGRGVARARPDAGAAGQGRQRRARLRLAEQLEPPRHGARP